MIDFRYFDKLGNPITRELWSTLFKDILEDGTKISTVWLGLNHQFGNGPPLIFETMVFGGKYDGEQERYSTLEEAQNGHKIMLDKCKGIVE